MTSQEQHEPIPVYECETGAPVPDPQPEPHSEVGAGLAYALGAYVWWGFIAIYFKAVAHVAPLNVLSQRIFWCSVMLAPLLVLRGQWGDVIRFVKLKSAWRPLVFATVLIAANWGIFIYAVSENRLAEASLGYFINPLFNVLIGRLVLGERLRPAQWVAVWIAAGAVVYLTFESGTLPWISLVLAGTFAVYGLVRKRSPAGPMVGLFFETTLLAPLAGGFLLWVALTGNGGPILPGRSTPFFEGQPDWLTTILLPLGGLVTAIPLLWFAAGARRLRLSTIGFVQYLAPTLQFLIAVFYFGEVFTLSRWITYGVIWLAVGIFVVDTLVRVARDQGAKHTERRRVRREAEARDARAGGAPKLDA